MKAKNTDLVKAIKKAIRKDSRKPSKERFQDLIDRGVIDKNGTILIRFPSAEYPR